MVRYLLSSPALFLLGTAFAQDVAQTDLRHDPAPAEVQDLFHQADKAGRAGDEAKAVALFTQVLLRDPENLNAYLQRGAYEIRLGDYRAAVADLTSVIQRKPDHQWAYTSRGSAYNKMGMYDLALRDFDTAIALDPKDHEAYNNRGWAKRSLNDQAGACRDWKQSRRLGDPEARIILENNHCK